MSLARENAAARPQPIFRSNCFHTLFGLAGARYGVNGRRHATEQGSTAPRPVTEGIRMIHHVSIPAREPQHVAEVLAELMGGNCFPFGPLEGAFMAASGDGHGSMIEVYPE